MKYPRRLTGGYKKSGRCGYIKVSRAHVRARGQPLPSPVRVAQCRETVIYQLTCPTQPWLPRIPKYPYSLDLRHEESAHGLFGTRQPSAPGTGPVWFRVQNSGPAPEIRMLFAFSDLFVFSLTPAVFNNYCPIMVCRADEILASNMSHYLWIYTIVWLSPYTTISNFTIQKSNTINLHFIIFMLFL